MSVLFETLFEQSNYEPIIYRGQKLFLYDIFPVRDNERLNLIFESTHSDWRQGVELQTTRQRGLNGWFVVDGKKVKSTLLLFQDVSTQVLDFTVRTKDGNLYVNNVWEKLPDPWAMGITYIGKRMSGAAMIIEDLPNGRRYRCNDGYPDEDFDDIVFRIERVDEKEG